MRLSFMRKAKSKDLLAKAVAIAWNKADQKRDEANRSKVEKLNRLWT